MVNISEDLFKEFLSSFRTRKFYKEITTISKSEAPYNDSVVESSFKIFSMDKLKKKINKKLIKESSSHGEHSSVDGLFYLWDQGVFILLFVEFKHVTSEKEIYSTQKEKFNIDLKIKPLESLYCVFPHLIDLYYKNEDNADEKIKSLKNFLFNCPKEYYCVIKDRCSVNPSNTQAMLNQDFLGVKRLSKYPFDEVKILTPETFKEFIE